jgi:hypothetical protein
MEKKPAISATIEDGILTITSSHGDTLTVHPDRLAAHIREQAILHGLKAKLIDAAAIPRNPDTGRSVSIEDKWDAITEVYDRITAPDGSWNKHAGGGGGAVTGGLLIRALMQLSGKPRDVVTAQVARWDKKQQAAMRAEPRVAAIIAKLQAPVMDVSSMLDGLLGDSANKALSDDADANKALSYGWGEADLSDDSDSNDDSDDDTTAL